MNRLQKYLTISCAVFAMSFSGVVWAACNVDSLQTNADFTQRDSGQGNLKCSDFIGRGGTMSALTSGVTFSGTTIAGSNGIDWSTTNPLVDVDIISVEGSDGKRCYYGYKESVSGGINLTPNSNQNVKTVTACSDGLFVAATEPPPAPISTADSCTGTIANAFQTAVNNSPDLRHVIAVGVGPGGDPTQAHCSADDAGFPSMVQCVNQCVRPAGYPNHIPSGTNCSPDIDGKINIDCRSCELASVVPTPQGVRYCWEHSHQVVNFNDLFFVNPDSGPTDGGATWQTFEGSACFLFTTTFFGVEYSYWTPAGCPN